jgi:hypothetical protein
MDANFGRGLKRQDARAPREEGLGFFCRRKRRGPIGGIFKRVIGWESIPFEIMRMNR